ncbi:MAG: nucleotidyltransferase domain-containing protein [Bdellovibrionaceae bacterium]|nr:nucleotidyltransferase domain-containing protein [Pseudobdellovibrionaceae bacterium]
MSAAKKSSRDSKELKAVVKALREEFAPLRIFLFGSRATGTHRDESDYDFVVVVKKRRGDRADNMLRARRALAQLDVKADVFVYSEKEFNDWKNEFSSIPETAVTTGKEITLG